MSCNHEIQALKNKLAQLEEIERLKKRIKDLECKSECNCCSCCSNCYHRCAPYIYGPITYPTITWGIGTSTCPSNPYAVTGTLTTSGGSDVTWTSANTSAGTTINLSGINRF